MKSSVPNPLDMIVSFANGGKPFVTVCYAQTLDGSISTKSGETLLISGPESMRLTHQLRSKHDGILVGVNTVLADNPRLNVRLVEGDNPRPIILDSRLRTPTNARLFSSGAAPIIFTSAQADASLVQDLVVAGASVERLPIDGNGRLALSEAIAKLPKYGIRGVMVEGGSQIITSFLELGLADGVVVTISPQFVGGINVVRRRLQQMPRIIDVGYASYGPDMVVWGRLK